MSDAARLSPSNAADAEVQAAARAVLETADPAGKCAAARRAYALWTEGRLAPPRAGAPSCAPARPARPERPALKPPGQVPRRRLGTQAGRIALLHAVAHIELNAVDLAFDLVARFGGDPAIAEAARTDFIGDWLKVGDDEARHFMLVAGRLSELGAAYGDLDAHDGLWDAALASAHDLAARLAIAPLVLEARGLDVTPVMINRLRRAEDEKSAAALEIIYRDEVTHVAAGARWFEHLCTCRGLHPESAFHQLVRAHFRGSLKPPFNTEARDRAGLPGAFYRPLAGGGEGCARLRLVWVY